MEHPGVMNTAIHQKQDIPIPRRQNSKIGLGNLSPFSSASFVLFIYFFSWWFLEYIFPLGLNVYLPVNQGKPKCSPRAILIIKLEAEIKLRRALSLQMLPARRTSIPCHHLLLLQLALQQPPATFWKDHHWFPEPLLL